MIAALTGESGAGPLGGDVVESPGSLSLTKGRVEAPDALCAPVPEVLRGLSRRPSGADHPACAAGRAILVSWARGNVSNSLGLISPGIDFPYLARVFLSCRGWRRPDRPGWDERLGLMLIFHQNRRLLLPITGFMVPPGSARNSNRNAAGNDCRMANSCVRLDWHVLCSTSRRIDSFGDAGKICTGAPG